jgi:hypothetical protein
MAQNRSSAVMAQNSTAPDSLSYFPTPLWGTRALCDVVLGGKEKLSGLRCWEPACGEGHMSRALSEYFAEVESSDIHDYGFGHVADFLPTPLNRQWRPEQPVDWIITNPPFNKGAEFARHALFHARQGVALLLRSSWLESNDRDPLFTDFTLSAYAPFIGRLPMFKGRLDRKGSTATAYAWFVWQRDHSGFVTETRLVRIPPDAKRRFDRDEDWR